MCFTDWLIFHWQNSYGIDVTSQLTEIPNPSRPPTNRPELGYHMLPPSTTLFCVHWPFPQMNQTTKRWKGKHAPLFDCNWQFMHQEMAYPSTYGLRIDHWGSSHETPGWTTRLCCCQMANCLWWKLRSAWACGGGWCKPHTSTVHQLAS